MAINKIDITKLAMIPVTWQIDYLFCSVVVFGHRHRSDDLQLGRMMWLVYSPDYLWILWKKNSFFSSIFASAVNYHLDHRYLINNELNENTFKMQIGLSNQCKVYIPNHLQKLPVGIRGITCFFHMFSDGLLLRSSLLSFCLYFFNLSDTVRFSSPTWTYYYVINSNSQQADLQRLIT